MARQLTATDARESLTAHVESKGVEIYLKYGPQIGRAELERLLADRACVRYPCEIVFDATALLPGEFAQPVQKGRRPEDGFTMFVHPWFQAQPDRVPGLVLYQLVAVNYGDFASAVEAETFGAAALGLTRDEYYGMLCEASDQLGADAPDAVPAPAAGGCSCGGSCGCG
jgi:hypothetical protein